jgi:hypothetical protein
MKYVDPSGYYWRFNKFVVSIETAIDGSTDPTYSRHAEYVWVTELELAWWAGLNSVDGGYVGGAGVSSGGGGGGVGGNYPGDVDQSDGGDGDNRGQVISFANGAAAYGFGVMGDIGAVVDSYGNSKLYLTVGGVIGYGAAAGMGYSRTGRYTSMDDFSGLAGGISLSGRKSPVSIEGYYDISHGAVRDYYGTNLYGGGINVGVGKGWFKYMSYTITFDPPSRDFWIHPATKR